MKLAVVVQRYGADINGGAELHARYIAERLSRHASVEVVTTCARDYVTWKNELPAGVEQVNGITVRRFPVARERKPSDFGRRVRRNAAEPFEFGQGTTTKSNHAMARLDQIAAHRQADLSNAHKTDRCHFANLSDDSVPSVSRYCIISSGGIGPHKFAASGVFGQVFGRCG